MTDQEKVYKVLSLHHRAVLILTFAVVLGVFSTIAIIHQQKALSKKNTQAIEVSCTLLANAIVESSLDNPVTEQAKIRQALNLLYIRQIMDLMTPAERKRVVSLAKKVRQQGSPISIPDCEKVSTHPKEVRQLQPKARK